MSRLLAGVLALAGLQTQPADIPITAIELRTERRTVPADVIAIHNRHHSPLVRWTVKASGAAGSYSTSSDYWTQLGPTIAGAGAIRPNEVRRTTYGNRRGNAQAVEIELAAFANGEVQGTRAAVADLERESAGLVDELLFWQTTLEALPRSPQSVAFAYVRDKVIERRRAVGEDRTGTSSRFESFFRAGVPRPIWWTFSGVDDLQRDLVDQLTRARRILAGTRTATHAVTAASASVEAGTEEALVIILKNLRSVPLEAWGYQEFDPASGGLRGGFSSYMPGPSAIPPGETREIRVLEVRPGHPASSIKPSFAIWQDLIWQGSASERASAMAGRGLQAEVLAFWIAQLKAVSGMTPQAAITSLRTALEERRRSAEGDRGGLMNANLESFARTAEQAPEQLHVRLEAFRQILEEQYARLARTR